MPILWHTQNPIFSKNWCFDIVDGKIWIQQDETEEGIAYDLVSKGIPKEQIVLAYKSIDRRKVTEFAVS
jgi:XisI protein